MIHRLYFAHPYAKSFLPLLLALSWTSPFQSFKAQSIMPPSENLQAILVPGTCSPLLSCNTQWAKHSFYTNLYIPSYDISYFDGLKSDLSHVAV